MIPQEDESGLLDAAHFMDSNECKTVIPAARNISGLEIPAILEQINQAGAMFGKAAKERFNKHGEW